ncbi:MAG: RNA polymerase factor sigma-54 [Magnetococcales bacterium]|nr:RNA polymerase factor sigma-54 [Magnetococcales bacterium]
MSLGLELKLRMGMHLVMTPQLQMAIRLLQMSSLELTDYLQEELDRNPLLEREDEEEGGFDSLASSDSSELAFGDEGAANQAALPFDHDGAPDNFEDEPVATTQLEGDLPNIDAQWSDIYDTSGSDHFDGDESPPLENMLSRAGSLTDHLTWQLGLSVFNERERLLGGVIIDAIDDNGYLTTPLMSLAELANASMDEMEDALVLVQSLEPAGVAARSLAECLSLQLKNMGMAKAPYTTLLEHLDDLARRDFRKLGRLLKLSEEELAGVVAVIQSLNPKPGLEFGSDQTRYIAPDVFVRKQNGEWVCEINADTVPKLRLNRFYQNAIDRNLPEQDKRFLIENTRSAQWLLKSLEQRSSTIYRVAESIVRFQKDFLEYGAEYLKPLILKDVAEDIGVHESTASRVTSNKFMHTPRGIFELKYFFSSSLNASDAGDNLSAEAVKYKIRRLVDSESTRRPYSDEALAKFLKAQGVIVARRTIAKYREAMGIPSSSRRKQLQVDG